MHEEDFTLLRRFVDDDDQAAFARLVQADDFGGGWEDIYLLAFLLRTSWIFSRRCLGSNGFSI